MNTNTQRTKLYGRLATEPELEGKIMEAKQHGAKVQRDKEAGTVCVTLEGAFLFKAIQKGEAGQPYIMMYNPDFYPRDEEEEQQAMIARTEREARQDPFAGFYLHNGKGQAIGANGRTVVIVEPADVIALPKFSTWQTVLVFFRWARPGREFFPATLTRGQS